LIIEKYFEVQSNENRLSLPSFWEKKFIDPGGRIVGSGDIGVEKLKWHCWEWSRWIINLLIVVC